MKQPKGRTPSLSLLCKLGSVCVHAAEVLSPKRHEFDVVALRGLLDDPEVVEWLSEMRAAALLPVPR